MQVAKGSFCGGFPKPQERAELRPFCGRLAVTKNCAPARSESDASPGPSPTPIEATGGTQTPTASGPTTAPAPVPVPDTAILGGPPSRTAARSAVFRFAAQGASSKGFECSVDGAPFAGCRSPAEFAHLRSGAHMFTVRALSPAGAPDTSPASYRWSVFDDLVPQSQPQPQPTPTQPKPRPGSGSPPVLVG
jgi:hypothetical protein